MIPQKIAIGSFSIGKAEEAQRRIGACVEYKNLPFFPPCKVAGVDVHYRDSETFAAVALLDYASLRPIKVETIRSSSHLEYISGFLAFKEAPSIFRALKEFSKPDVLLINGHGVSHPRGCGLATYVGVIEKLPTIGVALRPIVNARPNSYIEIDSGSGLLYISVGNLITLEQAEKITRHLLSPGVRLPLPLYLAHKAARLAVMSSN
ncbi:MAG: endonuclease V [Thermoproteota archaeon]